MTALAPDAPKQPAKTPAKNFPATSLLADFLSGLGLVAFVVWLAGVALSRGFGVHVPFLAGSILLFVSLVTLKAATVAVANTWHGSRVKADTALIAASIAAQMEFQQHVSGGGDLTALLDSLAKNETGPNPYL